MSAGRTGPSGPGMSVESDSAREGRDFVASFARGLAVIRAFDRGAASLTLSQVARRADITRAASRRLLLTLRRLGYVQSDGRRFALTAKILDLGFAYLDALALPELASSIMKDVVREVEESCSAAVLDGEDIVYVARIPTAPIISARLGIGGRLPAYCTSMGRVLLSGLPDPALDGFLARATLARRTEHTVTDANELRRRVLEVREVGHALVDQELETTLRAIAVPIRGRNGTVIAAVNVGSHVSRASRDDLVRRMLPSLRRAAARIEEALR